MSDYEQSDVYFHSLDENGDIEKQALLLTKGPSKSLIVYFSWVMGEENGEEWVRNDELHDPSKWRIYFDRREWLTEAYRLFEKRGTMKQTLSQWLDTNMEIAA